ncbi:FecR domain-containing protein [Thauera sp. Sel9]|uniref:FecR domain-containing protein n=1 Tax=Thauera sp. Sel9 TaxID=2974299 RepID=UPI0021E19244|nr:FecR domain-containing protein [Thauera sp. Sel9]MCV2216041.1 FecR domain-containing protein [Thauera sp. Sel9]
MPVATPQPSADFDPETARRAVEWLFELQEDGDAEAPRQAFEAWLAEHPEHRRAWEHIQHVNARLHQVADNAPPVRKALLAPRRRQRRDLLIALLAAGSIGGLWLNSGHGRRSTGLLADLRTGVGERRTLELADGSELAINSDSALDVRFDGQVRQLTLHRGEILIRTAPDEARRPFLVLTRYGTLHPLGTRFAVRVLSDAGHLAVFEGAVAVLHRGDTAPRATVQAGQQLRFAPGLAEAPRTADANTVAWRDGILVASNMRLADFLAEVGRHRHGRLACAPEIADWRVSGTYRLDDTDRILDVLRASLPVRIHFLTRYWVTVHPAA